VTHPYNHANYARTLAPKDDVVLSQTLGVPLRLRTIAGTGLIDASGLYPLSPNLCQPTRDDLLAELRGLGAVSLVLVSDPLATTLPECFDLARPYKAHHVIDPALGAPGFSKHHRAEVRRAQRHCTARQILLGEHLQDFIRLYNVLIERHGLDGVHRFGPEHFAHLAAHPDDFPTFGAFVEGRLVSAHIWAQAGNCAYSHLAASDPKGYEIGASYAVYDCAIRHLSGCTLTLGGIPDGPGGDGLTRFKRGFANSARHPHLCGVIADQPAYDRLSAPALHVDAESVLFPLYRSLPDYLPPTAPSSQD